MKELAGRYNFIVPEIQREYVWGNNEHQILDSFFTDVSEKYIGLEKLTGDCFQELKTSIAPVLIKDFTKETLTLIEKGLERFEANRSMNIGFLYSYKPSYYIFNDTSEDVYLIDGQQRFTTLFIALFYFAVLEGKDKLSEFENTFRINLSIEKIGFDYRVRTITHNFLIDLIGNTKTKDDLKDIINKTWFLSEYRNDTSIRAILGTFSKLNKNYAENTTGYFDFLMNHVKFWHFKTEETSQGEELYITMNSRGKSLSDNEILRATLFEKLVKNEVRQKGQDWEDWQDFFWNKKGNNENADNGFNEFLRWVQILTMVSGGIIDTENEDEEGTDKKAIIDVIKWERVGMKLDAKYLLIKDIGSYFTAVEYLFKKFSIPVLEITYSKYLNKEVLDSKWLCPATGSTIGQKECFRLLPVIQYIKLLIEQDKFPDNIELYRVIRYFYNLNAIESVNKSPNVACINAIKLITDLIKKSTDIADVPELQKVSKTLLTEEEKYKFCLFKKSENRLLIEQEFWAAEDHKLNSGRIGHLIQASFESLTSIETFKYENNFDKVRKLDFDVTKFSTIRNKYFVLNPDKDEKISDKLWGFLLPTPYYTVSDYGNNKIITCQGSDYLALISKEFLKMVLEIDENETRDNYLMGKAKLIFDKYSEANKLKDEVDLKIQLFCYFLLLTEMEDWGWYKGKNFGCYDKSDETDFRCLFSNKIEFQHYGQKWGGAGWRMVNLESLLNGDDHLQKIEDGSFWVTNNDVI
ncbi:MAG: DUF262 domain-containing protein [Bacteroidetes bacterium]|nr:DUF262 domain-containing protein [Bacteroidota bacterium]